MINIKKNQQGDKLRGIIPYLPSPTDSNGMIKTTVLSQLCEDLVKTGVHGLSALGSTGEFAYLGWDERKKVAKTVVDAVDRRIPVLLGVSATTVKEAVRQAQEMEKIGSDAINLAIDTYTSLNVEGLVEYYKCVAESVSIPIVVYLNKAFSDPSVTSVFFRGIRDIKNIKYVKDATGRTGQLLSILNHFGKNLTVFSASAHVPVCVMLLGGAGWMAGPACLIPRQSVSLYDYTVKGDWRAAVILQRKLWGLNEIFLKYDPAAVIKYGLNLQGYEVGEPLCPGSTLPENVRKELRTLLQDL